MAQPSDREGMAAWIADQIGSGRIALVRGGPLAGRTTAWRHAVGNLRELGAEVLEVRASVADRGRPWATAQRWLARWVDLAEGTAALRATRGLDALSGLAPELGSTAGPLEPAAIQAAVDALLRRLARAGPVWVAVDDLQWADGWTLDLFQAVALGSEGRDIGWFGTDCPAEGDGPLGLDGPVWELGQAVGPTVSSQALERRAARRMVRLDPGARRMLEALAVADRSVELDDLGAVAEVDEVDPAVAVLEAHGWVRLGLSGPMAVITPVGEWWMGAVRAGIGARQGQRLHGAWLRRPLAPEHALRHTLGAGTEADPEAVDRLFAAGRSAQDARRFGEARRFLVAARDLAVRRGTARAEHHEWVGRGLAQVDPEAALGAWSDALAGDPEPAARARIRRHRAMLLWDLQSIDEALAEVEEGWRELEGHTGPEVEALVRTELIFRERRMDYDALGELATRLEEVAVSPEARSELWQVRASERMYRGEDGALEAIQRGLEEARGVTEHRVMARAAHSRNMALIAMGRPREALTAVVGGEDTGPYETTALALARYFLADLAGLRAVLEQVGEEPGRRLVEGSVAALTGDPLAGGDDYWRPFVHEQNRRVASFVSVLRALHAEACHDPHEVIRLIDGSGLVRPGGLAGPMPTEVARLLGLALARVGRLDEAREVVARLEERGAYDQLCAALIRAELQVGDPSSAAALVELAVELDRRGLVRHAAWCKMWAVDRDPGLPEARALLDAAWAVFAPLGADPDLADLRRLYQEQGHRPPVTPRRGRTDGPLSARELEVVQWVARGLRNKEVAAQLYVSPATVATHLKRIYKRLDVNNRAALTAWAADQGVLDS